MWKMLERLPELPVGEHHVAVMHYWPFIEQLDEPDWDLTNADQYYDWYFSIDVPHRRRLWDLLKAAGVEVLFCGHVHTGRPVQEVEGIRLYRTQPAGNTGQLAERWPEADTRFGFHRCDVGESGIEVTFVVGEEQCDGAAGGGVGEELHGEQDRDDHPAVVDPPTWCTRLGPRRFGLLAGHGCTVHANAGQADSVLVSCDPITGGAVWVSGGPRR